MGALLFILLLVLIFFGLPIGFCILLSSTVFLQVTSLKPLLVVAQKLALGLDSSSLLAIPLFTLMGYIMESCGLSKRLIDWVYSLFGGFKGAMGLVTIICCTIFAALSGSGPATVAAIGSILIPAMIENGYPPKTAAGLTAMAGALGPHHSSQHCDDSLRNDHGSIHNKDVHGRCYSWNFDSNMLGCCKYDKNKEASAEG